MKEALKTSLSPKSLLLRKTKSKNLRGTFFFKKKVGMALRPRECAHQTAVLCITEVPNNGMAGAKRGGEWLARPLSRQL